MRFGKSISHRIFLIPVICLLFLLAGCKSFKEKEDELPDTKYRGAINVSADESFKPVIDELVQVYESHYPGAKINVHYKTEAECLQDMLTDSVRMIITTRSYNEDERSLLVDSMKVSPRSMTVARDGIAVIVHPSSPDSMFRMKDIREILAGRFKKNLIPVFDGLKATSTIRFIIDSVLRGDTLTSKAMAARSSEAVLDYVSKTPNAVGFIGVGWIGNREDSSQLSFLRRIRVANIESTDIPDAFVKAYQANIYIKRYPMVRDLVYILKENHKGLGTGFANFMSGEIGQLIFKRAYLAPSHKGLGIRPVKLNE